MKKVLVTGADGFIGSHLTELLVGEGYEVKALSQYNSFNYWGWLEDVACLKQIEVLNGDVRDPHYCKKITKDVDVVFHLAALIAIPYSYVAPDSYLETNVKGVLNICQAALENGVQRVVHTSTSEVYGTAQYVPIDEKHPLQPQSPYSASKIAADAMAMSFFNAFDLPVTIARPFNTYGPRQSARAVIPTIIAQIAKGMKQIKLGDVFPTRDFNYVIDTCRGFLELARCEKAIGETVNIGSNYEISVGDTLKLIRELMGSDVEFVTDDQRLRPEKSEVFRLWCDNSKIHELTGFEPTYSIREGLQETINWFVRPENLAKYKADLYNV
ncbi:MULTISPECIES: NAD-dependent 4,6-dehydratase LegB [Pseudomonas aeruginosa group]|uniref:3-beta hydroxysteroid dehydrogenase/isomerase family protein n=2 Tax=Pseudomonas aeruginosa group TaxID=136841 RepID=A0A2R3J022_9PSED|nr:MULTISPECIES: NAD-dependent 4,6-dehydratase LegB [Pseudomonas aeruginosa group]WKW47787.1 NAD-dependent dehydratase [Cloning vector pMA11O12]VTS30743.1 dTDP-glucose 4,6-dehydratase [Streptococcus dysgalactiae subsp. equisimilis]AAM27586.1 ORF_5; similar to NAD dependent epimerase/dehydratase f [Pseudomonas aeruginosa]AVK07524.1 3-beta hydroxysteroid dehydrogenase/isomerase family protein [Pseudomonas paraeruginosa]AVR67136.1 NAD-dependent dehydratase [Pseudomonas paraeruginosa]